MSLLVFRLQVAPEMQVALSCDCLSLKDIDAFRQANAEWARAHQRTRSG